MLAASKDTLVAGLKQNALLLRHKELEYYVERYSNITTQASTAALTTALTTAALTTTAIPITLTSPTHTAAIASTALSATLTAAPPPPPPCPAQASILAGFAFDSLVELEIPSNVYESRAAVVTV